MNIKKLIRLILKVPVTPFVVTIHLVFILVIQAVKVFEWVYEANDFDKRVTRSTIEDSKQKLKKWFTTI